LLLPSPTKVPLRRPSFRHVVAATIGTQRQHVKGGEDCHALRNNLTRYHWHGIYAPRSTRRACQGAPRGYRPLPLLQPTNTALEMMGGGLCTKCECHAAPGDKLRYCGRCAEEPYCSKHCAQAGWPVHKLVCERMRRAHANALADHEARGGRR
jgi:hypothetical protein